jgi:predicted nucleic acid-binding Zn ribbon protein
MKIGRGIDEQKNTMNKLKKNAIFEIGMNEEKICLNCSKALRGRADKKFCDENCRNQYNNTRNSDTNAEMRLTQNILRKNRRILSELLGEQDKYKTSIKKLIDRGYNLDFLTQLYQTKTGTIYRYCFEYGIMLLDEDMVLIVKRN